MTIDELKTLREGDWVWVRELNTYVKIKEIGQDNVEVYVSQFSIEFMYIHTFMISTYGTKWLAFKNKEQAEAKSEIIELPCKTSCVAVEAYKVESDCSFCDFNIGGDHYPWCKFQDSRKEYHGKPICKYKLKSRFIPIDKLDGTECLDKVKAQQECDELNYDHACAVRAYCGSSMYLDDMGDLVKSITKEEAERRLAESRGEK